MTSEFPMSRWTHCSRQFDTDVWEKPFLMKFSIFIQQKRVEYLPNGFFWVIPDYFGIPFVSINMWFLGDSESGGGYSKGVRIPNLPYLDVFLGS